MCPRWQRCRRFRNSSAEDASPLPGRNSKAAPETIVSVLVLVRAVELLTRSVPALTVVLPVKLFEPVSVHTPAPVFTREVGPPLSPMDMASLFWPELALACNVRVRAPVWPLKPMAAVLLIVSGPVPAESRVPPLVPTLKRRFVVASAPV